MSDDVRNAMRRLQEAGDSISPEIRDELEGRLAKKAKNDLRRTRGAKAYFRAGLDELAGVDEPELDVERQLLIVELAAAARKAGLDPADAEGARRFVAQRADPRRWKLEQLTADVVDELTMRSREGA